MSENSSLIHRSVRRFFGGLTLALSPVMVQAEYIDLPPPGSELIGQMRYVRAKQGDTLIDIAHAFSVGQDEIVMANPTTSRWLPGEGTRVLIPRRYILPDAPRTGIVVNIPEMRLYYFPSGQGKNPPTQVITYPISIGRMDWKSPIGVTKIVEKIKNPTWTPPESIKKEHALEGDILPDVVPAGPDNPLGLFAMRLGVKGSYLIHGTDQDKADGIGMMVTHGCMRMYPEDVEQLFPKVSVGTQVNLVNQPVKLGWDGNVLYIEVSQPLDEDHLGYDQLLSQAMSLIQKKTAVRPDFVLNGEALKAALTKPNGIPVAISGGAVGAALTAQPENIPVIPHSGPVQSTTLPVQSIPAVGQGVVSAPQPLAPAQLQPSAQPVQQPAQVPASVGAMEEAPPGPMLQPASSKSEQQMLPPIY